MIGPVPRTYPSLVAVPEPLPGASDITLSSDWTSLSMPVAVRGLDGSIMHNGEATFLALTGSFEVSELLGGVRSSEAIATSFL